MVDRRAAAIFERLQNPRIVLFIDFIGALITSLATLLLLATEIVSTGLPTTVLVLMAAVAFGFACFDLFGILFATDVTGPLATIAVLNGIYVLGTLFLCAIHYAILTPLGATYFLIEAVVVILLVRWEWKVVERNSFR